MFPMSTLHSSAVSTRAARASILAPMLWLAACASVPIRQGGTLASYDGLSAHKSRQSRAQLRVDADKVLAAKTVRIVPTRFGDGAGAGLTDRERMLVANRVDRELCRGLARRLDVVGPDEVADLSVQTTITHLGKTGKVAAGASVLASFVSVVPVINPRVPFGLGSLGVEAEALDPSGRQEAAMLWTGKARSIGLMSNASISRVGDAYQLSSEFGGKFSQLITTGRSPFKGGPRIKMPSLKGKKDADCKVFGYDSGIIGMFADNFGVPPGWTDKGARKPNARPDADTAKASQ